MRARTILPLVALLALVACGEDGPDQTGSTDNNNPPPSTAPANPASGGSTTPAQ